MKRKIHHLTALILILSLFLCASCKEEEESYPYALGDIILSDGSIVHFADRQFITEEQKSKAIGVVFYVYYKDYDDEITGYIKGSSSDNIKALALAFNYDRRKEWARASTTGNRTKFTGLVNETKKTGCNSWNFIFNRLKDEQLISEDYLYEDPESSNPDERLYMKDEKGNPVDIWHISPEGNGVFEENNYPAFYYANTYAEKYFPASLSFAGKCYIPSIAELKMINRNIRIVQPALDAAESGLSLAGCGAFWSSTQSDNNRKAEMFSFSNGTASSVVKEQESHVAVCFELY